METDSLKPVIMPMIKRTVEHNVQMNTVGDKKDWNLDGIVDFAIGAMVNEDSISKDDFAGKSQEEIVSYLMQKAEENYASQTVNLKRLLFCVWSMHVGLIISMKWISYANRSVCVVTAS